MDSLIKFCAKYLFIIVVLIFVYAWLMANRKYKIRMGIAVVLAGIVAGILDKIAGKLYYDPRPFVTHHVNPLIAHTADNGFPSEHTIFTFTIAAVLYFYRPKLSYLAFGLALLVGIGRVAAHVHSPIDIIGGIAIGLVSGWAGYQLSEYYVRRSSKKAVAKS
jgi:undecaprenyl-diphosphatase